MLQLVVGHHAQDEPDAVSLVGVNQTTGQHELPGPRGPDQAGQQPAHPDVASREAEADEGDVEARRGAGNANVAGQGQGEATSGRRTVDGGNDRLGQGT
jgi:hypothetical protein